MRKQLSRDVFSRAAIYTALDHFPVCIYIHIYIRAKEVYNANKLLSYINIYTRSVAQVSRFLYIILYVLLLLLLVVGCKLNISLFNPYKSHARAGGVPSASLYYIQWFWMPGEPVSYRFRKCNVCARARARFEFESEV